MSLQDLIPRGGVFHIKVTGMLVVSLWGVSQILASLRVFGMENHYVCPIRYLSGTVHKETYKKCPDTDHTENSGWLIKINFARHQLACVQTSHQHDTERTQKRAGLSPSTRRLFRLYCDGVKTEQQTEKVCR